MDYPFFERFDSFQKQNFRREVSILNASLTNLDPDIKARWIAALRSGEYKQGPSYLCYGDEYCCLGVLAKSENTPMTDPVEGRNARMFIFGEEEVDSLLPDGAFGLPVTVQGVLAKFNDHFDLTFEEIANVIEDLL